MPSWVVPSLAAEFWHVTLDQVNHLVKTGQIQTKTELGFELVNIGKPAPGHKPAITNQTQQTSPTFTPAHSDASDEHSMEDALIAATESPVDSNINEAVDPSLNFEWRQSRNKTARLRKAPTKSTPTAIAA